MNLFAKHGLVPFLNSPFWVAELPETEKNVWNIIQTILEGTRRETRTKADQCDS